MEKPDNRIDLQFLLETVRQYAKDNGLSASELGRIIAPHCESNNGHYLAGKKLLEGVAEPSLQQVGALADAMGTSFIELLRPISYSLNNHCLLYTSPSPRDS